MVTMRTCKHCGRHRNAHGKKYGQCPNPDGKTWTSFEETPCMPDGFVEHVAVTLDTMATELLTEEERKTLTIDLLDIERGQPHWLSGRKVADGTD